MVTQPFLPKSHLPKQNWADSGTAKIIYSQPNQGPRADGTPCTFLTPLSPYLDLGEPLAAVKELGDLGRVPTDEPLSREVLHAVLGVQVEEVQPDAVLPLPQDVVLVAFWGQLYKIRSSRKIDSRRLFSRE